MRFKSVTEVLDFVRQFHQRASELFHRLEDGSHSKRIKMLLEYVSQHEARLADALGRYEHKEHNAALNSWFSSAPEIEDVSLDVGSIGDDLSVEQAVSLAIQIDDYLIALYRAFAAHAPNERVRELFADLLRGEIVEERILSRNAWMAEDF